MVTRSAITTWYPTLIKPSFNPPNWILHQLDVLYVMMGVAAGLVWDRIEVERELEKSAFFLCNSIGT
jgi:tryptophan-rich sensory protein